MSEEHERLRVSLGAHLLGGLPAEESRALEAHLASCADCRAERDELLPTVAALGAVRRHPATGPSPDDPPADLGSRILAGVSAERALEQRRSWRQRAALTGIGAAAAAVVLVVGLAVTRPDPAPTVPLEAVAVQVEEPGITADADLVNHTWGVEVKLHGTGFRDGARYEVMVLGTDGRTYPAGEFVGTGTTVMDCNLNSSVLRAAAAGFEVLDARGGVVVTSRFT